MKLIVRKFKVKHDGKFFSVNDVIVIDRESGQKLIDENDGALELISDEDEESLENNTNDGADNKNSKTSRKNSKKDADNGEDNHDVGAENKLPGINPENLVK